MSKNHPIVNDIKEIVNSFKKDIIIVDQDTNLKMEISHIYTKKDKIYFILESEKPN